MRLITLVSPLCAALQATKVHTPIPNLTLPLGLLLVIFPQCEQVWVVNF